jgi:signal transduction histidine kinase
MLVSLIWHPKLEAGGLSSAIETAITLSALIAVVLLGPDLRRTRRVRDLMLTMALATVAVTDVVSDTLPAFSADPDRAYGTGAHLACALLLTVTFVVAAYARPGRLVRRGGWPVVIAAFTALSVVAIGEAAELAATGDGLQSPASAAKPMLIAFALFTFVGLLVAGYGFVSRAGRRDYDSWSLAGAAYLLAAGALQTLALPIVPADWVTPREPFRILAFALLLVTAVRLYGKTREQVGHAVAHAEQVRIAHDLHDGLAQDLAYIVTYADRMERVSGEGHALVIAARRALDASRGAIVDLEASRAPCTAAALGEVATELERRYGIQVTVRVLARDDPEPSAGDRREIVRIAREAIVNAARHGTARHVTVTLGSRRDAPLLRVTDDGRRPDGPESPARENGGHGLPTMRARAEMLDAQLVTRSYDEGGTEITVIVNGSKSPAAG